MTVEVATTLPRVEVGERRPPLKVSVVDVALFKNGYPMVFVTVTAPVAADTAIPEPASTEVTKLVEVEIW